MLKWSKVELICGTRSRFGIENFKSRFENEGNAENWTNVAVPRIRAKISQIAP